MKSLLQRLTILGTSCLVGVVAPSVAVSADVPQAVGTSLPSDFPAPRNPYLGTPVLGFGASGHVKRVPVIFVHGNNDTPFPTACNPFGYIQNAAQHFVEGGYRPSEIWGLGYQGDQCDLAQEITRKSGVGHGTMAGVDMLRKFVHAVLDYTHSEQVDIVAHSLGVTVAREWMRQDGAYRRVRALVAIDGPNHGIINCSPSPANFYQQAAQGGFVPNSSICEEYGSDHTQLLSALNRGSETPGPTHYLVIRNVGSDFVFVSAQDGPFLPAVPAEDRDGNPHDFSNSALLTGAPSIDLTGQGGFDPVLQSAHLGILNSPQAWNAAFEFLQRLRDGR